MSTVDNRVVRMVFDNESFERKIKTTMSTLSEFDKSLKLDGATAGFDKVSKAAYQLDVSGLSKNVSKETSKIDSLAGDAAKSINSIDNAANSADFSALGRAANTAVNDVNDAVSAVNMSSISNEAYAAGDSFSALETIAVGALFNIGSTIEEMLVNKLKDVANNLISPIKEGFSEYETQIGSIQTILANTGLDFDSDEDIALVNESLDELNKYADDTIYKFTDMTQAIGTFTAAGLDLDTAVAAVKGVSNVAAMSGATASDVHRVLPQISQALSSGSVTLQDWRSIETAHMNSAAFVEAIGDMAVHMARVDQASEEAAEAGEALLNHEVNMRQALNKQDYKEWSDWFNSDILTNTFEVFTYDLRSATAEEEKAMRSHLESLGYVTKEEQDAIFARAEMATRSATEVRTWTQLWDTVGEAIGSNWAGVWRNFIGDFKQATDTFTFLSHTLSKGIDGMFSGIINVAKRFNDSGAIDLIFGKSIKNEITGEITRTEGALDHFVNAIGKPLNAIKQAFDSVFGISDDELSITLVSIAGAIERFASSLVISDDAAEGLTGIFEGLFSVLKVGLQIVADAVGGFFDLLEAVRVITDPIMDLALVISGKLGEGLKWVADKFFEVRAAVFEALSPFQELLWAIEDIIEAIFGMLDLPGKVDIVADSIFGVVDGLWKFVDLPGKIRLVGNALRDILGFIGDITGWNDAAAEANRIWEETGESVNTADIWFERLSKNPIGSFITRIVDGFKKIGEVIGPLLDAIKNFAGRVKDAFLAWEPIKNLIDRLNEFKDGAINFFLSIPDRLAGSADKINGELSGIEGFFGGIVKWFQDTTKYFNELTVEKFLEDMKNWANGVLEHIKGVYDYLTTLTPEKLAKDISKALGDLGEKLYGALQTGAKNIESFFPELNGSLSSGLADIKKSIDEGTNPVINTLKGWAEGVKGYFKSVADRADGPADAFRIVFEDAKQAIENGINNINNFFKNNPVEFSDNVYANIEGFSTNVGRIMQNAANEVEKHFPILGGAMKTGLANIDKFLHDTINGIKAFIDPILEESDSLPDFFKNLFIHIGEAIIEGLENLEDNLRKFFKPVLDVIKDASDKIWNALENLPGVFGEAFKVIHEKLDEFGGFLRDGVKSIPNLFKSMFGGVDEPVDGALSHLKRFWDGLKIENAPESVGGFAENIKNFIKEKMGSVEKFIGGIPEKFKDIFGKFEEFINSGVVDRVIDFIKSILVGRLIWSLSDFFKGVGELTKSGAKYLDMKRKDGLVDNIKDIAESITMIAGSIAIIGMLPQEKIDKGVYVIGGIAGGLIGMEIVSGILNRFLPVGEGGNSAKDCADFLKSIALAMLILGNMDPEQLGKAEGTIAIVGAILVAMQTIPTLVNALGGQWVPGNMEGVSDMAKGLLYMAVSMLVLSAIDPDKLDKAQDALTHLSVCLGGLELAVGLSNRLSGGWNAGNESAIKSIGKGMLMLGAAMWIIGEAVLKVKDVPWYVTTLFEGAAIGLMYMLGKVSKDSKSIDTVLTAAAFDAVAFGMLLIGDAVRKVADVDWSVIAAFEGGAVAIIKFLGDASKNSKGLDTVAVGLAFDLIAVGMMGIGEAIRRVADVDWSVIAAFEGGAAAMLYMLGKASKDTKALDTVATGAAFDLVALGMYAIGDAIRTVSDVDWGIMALFEGAAAGILYMLGKSAKDTGAIDILTTGAAFDLVAAGMICIGEAVRKVSDVDWTVITSFEGGASILLGVLGAVAKLTGSMDLAITSLAFDAMAGGMLILGEAVSKLQGLDWSVIAAFEGGASVLMGVFGAVATFTSGIDLIATAGAFDMFAAAIWGISEAMLNFVEVINTMPDRETIANAGFNLITGLAEGIARSAEYIWNALVNLCGEIINRIKEFFGIHSPSEVMADEIGQYLPAGIAEGINLNADTIFDTLGQLIERFFEWVETDGLPMLGQAIENFMNWAATDGIPALGQFLQDIFAKLGEFVQNFMAWMQSDGIPMLMDAAAKFGDWAINEGIPALLQFLGDVLKHLGEFAANFLHWVATEGLPMLGKALADFAHWCATDGIPALLNFIGDIFKELGKLPGMLGDWIVKEGLPMVGKAITDLMAEAGKIGEKLIEWAKGIPGYIGKGIKQIWDDFVSVGDNIVQGIVKGITGGIDWITNAINGLGESALNGIKNFFGIESPSKVMREEVGKYIPAGVAEGVMKYASAVAVACKDMGQQAVAGVNSVLGRATYDMGQLPVQSITPVVDMQKMSSQLDAYRQMMAASSIDTNTQLNSSVNASINLESLKTMMYDMNNRELSVMSSLGDSITRISDTIRSESANMRDTSMQMAEVINSKLNDSALINLVSRLDHNINSLMYDLSANNTINKIGFIDDRLSDIQNDTYTLWLNSEKGTNIFMDTGALVGAIAPEMDNQLGYRQMMAERGVV